MIFSLLNSTPLPFLIIWTDRSVTSTFCVDFLMKRKKTKIEEGGKERNFLGKRILFFFFKKRARPHGMGRKEYRNEEGLDLF